MDRIIAAVDIKRMDISNSEIITKVKSFEPDTALSDIIDWSETMKNRCTIDGLGIDKWKIITIRIQKED